MLKLHALGHVASDDDHGGRSIELDRRGRGLRGAVGAALAEPAEAKRLMRGVGRGRHDARLDHAAILVVEGVGDRRPDPLLGRRQPQRSDRRRVHVRDPPAAVNEDELRGDLEERVKARASAMQRAPKLVRGRGIGRGRRVVSGRLRHGDGDWVANANPVATPRSDIHREGRPSDLPAFVPLSSLPPASRTPDLAPAARHCAPRVAPCPGPRAHGPSLDTGSRPT